MYAQLNHLQVPMGSMAQIRRMVTEEYLPVLRVRNGFVAAYLLEQIDDADNATLVVMWANQAAVEAFNSTGMLEASVHSLAASVPGVKVTREGYQITAQEENASNKPASV